MKHSTERQWVNSGGGKPEESLLVGDRRKMLVSEKKERYSIGGGEKDTGIRKQGVKCLLLVEGY
ncbi:MAG: hypothetical protein NZ901_04840 [Geminocystis sp.]|nr:hypothetical protein [Geminocystis sp.]HIK37131.1 hypothetical protein [Geminocystis sp. M7585_C2015_104]MCS7147500.1 hypothetical protein [Geminocystis sp.]MCX8077903.1 hypothetical protein [Geminocystis sp.]MDW8115193.1 hypothetical protein [Geminocystis sp.]